MTELHYRFRIADAEFRRAWLTEYFRRPGWRAARIVMGPGLVVLGASSLRGPAGFNRIMGGVCVALGLYYALKPFLAAWILTKRRRESGQAESEIGVTLDEVGVLIEQREIRTRLDWDGITRAGRGRGYIWYELRGGTRATIPLRAVEDEAMLVAHFEAHTEWVG